MSLIYRSATAESKDIARRSLCTTWPGSAERVAQVEAAALIPSDSALYSAEVTIGDKVRRHSVDELLLLGHDKPRTVAWALLRDMVLEVGEKLAATGHEWVALTDHGREWEGAMLYMGDTPIRTHLASDA